MREICLSGSEGGVRLCPHPYPYPSYCRSATCNRSKTLGSPADEEPVFGNLETWESGIWHLSLTVK
jgi:hypothetical protein